MMRQIPMMKWSKRPLIVFAGDDIIEGKQYRLLVAAHSRSEASRITKVSTSRIKRYWLITRNEAEVELAQSKPGTIFIHEYNYTNAPWAEYIP